MSFFPMVHSIRILSSFLIIISVFFSIFTAIIACSNGECKVKDRCSSDKDCAAGLHCYSCVLVNKKCIRSTSTDQFKLVNNSLPFNKYAFLTTHNSFAINNEPSHTKGPRITLTNQEDSVTMQLKNGVRGLMLDTYDFNDTVWLCHSLDGKCVDLTAFVPAIDTLREIEAFLSKNPSEIVTIILEDYVKSPNGLTNIFRDSGLKKYWFPVEKMPKKGEDWPLVKDMVAKNERLIVFTSKESKQQSEGIAYQWNFMVENEYGNNGEKSGRCNKRSESSELNDKTKSLVLINHFKTIPVKELCCNDNSKRLMDTLQTCYSASGNRWANFVAVDFYKRSEGGGAFQAVDKMNGELQCGADDVHACAS